MTRSYWFLISLLAGIWGASYLFIKVAVRDFSPPAMMELRLAFAALLLGGFLVATRGFRAALTDVRGAGWHGLFIGVVNGAIPFTLIALGEKYIDSGVAAIANSTVPIFNVMLAPLMLPSERTTGVRLVGFILGLVGVGVLSGAQPTVTTVFVLGTLAVVLASVSYAFSGLYAQKRLTTATGPALATASMTGGALALLPLAIIFAPEHTPGLKSVASLAALTLFGTALAQLILYRLLRSHGAARTSLVTYLMPPIALVYGAVLLDESITAATLGGLALILAGVALGSGAVPSRATSAGDPGAVNDVRLRRATPDDLDFLVDVFSDDDVRPFMAAGKALDRDALARELERQDAEPQAYGRFVVELDGEPAATLAFERRSPRNRIARCGGLAVHPRFRGRRLADTAARIFQRHLIFDLDYHRLEMVVYGFNDRAQRHAERAGWVMEGVKRKAYLRGDEWVDGVMYGLVREDLEP